MAFSGSKIGSTAGAGIGAAAGSFIPGVGTGLGMMIGSALGGIVGGLFDEGPDVQKYIDEAARLYEDIVPPDLAKAIVYAQYKQGGTLTPQQLSELPIEAQPVVKLRESPEFKQKQQVQLQQLEQLARTGMGPQERLALEKSRQAAAADAQSRLKSLMQQYQQMGQLGGGAAFAAQLSSAQAADQQEAMTNMQAAAMAADNRRNAIQQAFTAASGMRQQDLQVNQYNTENLRQKQIFDVQNALNRQQLNAQYANQANMVNLQRQQQVMDMNLQQYNQELYRQQYLAPQQMYMNQMAMANARSNILMAQAGLAQQQAQAQAQNDMNYMTGLMNIGQGVMGMQQNNQLLGQRQDALELEAAKSGFEFDDKGNLIKTGAAPASPGPAPLASSSTSTNSASSVAPLIGAGANVFSSTFNRPTFDNRFSLGTNYDTSTPLSMPQMGSQLGQPVTNTFNLGFGQQMGMGGFQAGQGSIYGPNSYNPRFDPYSPNYYNFNPNANPQFPNYLQYNF
jgi:hypothetical protein